MLFNWRTPRFLIFATCMLAAVSIYQLVLLATPREYATALLSEYYGLSAFLLLYASLLVSPLYAAFPHLPGKAFWTLSRRSLGVSAFVFACTHVYFSFFDQLGGFAGLPYLDARYLFAITLSTIALAILFLLTCTSTDYAVRRLGGKRWKWLHRLIYPAGLLIVIHAVLLGSHFTNLASSIPKTGYVLVGFLLLLQARRLDVALDKTGYFYPLRFGISSIIVISLLTLVSGNFFTNGSTTATSTSPLNIHAQHAQVAQNVANGTNVNIPLTAATMPGLQGDRTKRYSVGFEDLGTIQANQTVNVRFTVTDAATGQPVELYSKPYEQPLHLIIVDSELTYFSHLHPIQDSSHFSLSTTFPHTGLFYLYLDFQPFGAIEQQFTFTVPVGTNDAKPSIQRPDELLSKTVDSYKVQLTPDNWQSSQLSTGSQSLNFTVQDSAGKPVTTLKPYLRAFGHLVMVNQKTHEFVHVHPTGYILPGTDTDGGPGVEFLPIGLYAPIRPGIYRIFAQFNPDNHLITADFTISVQ